MMLPRSVGVLCALVLFIPPSQPAHLRAQETSASLESPVGRWETVDDATGEVQGIVAIHEENGILTGTIEQVLERDVPEPNPPCIYCGGDLKNHPLIGLQFMWGLKKDGEQWNGGHILDPHNGGIYRCYVAVVPGGKKLKVRGYMGIPLLGRTLYWERVE